MFPSPNGIIKDSAIMNIFLGYIIAKAFGELEKSNLSYCDISGNNILIKIAKGASVEMINLMQVAHGAIHLQDRKQC